MIAHRWALVAIALVTACGADGPGEDECFGVCGPGTRCAAGTCVVAEVAATPETTPPEDAKRSRRGRRRRADDAPDGAAIDGAAYQPVDDRKIPRYDPDATVVLDPAAGSERLDDTRVRASLRALEPAFDRCIADAVAAGIDVGSGEVRFELGVAPSGKVTGVNARAPAALRDAGVDGCLRKAIYEHRFPGYDGPPMGVDYSFEYG